MRCSPGRILSRSLVLFYSLGVYFNVNPSIPATAEGDQSEGGVAGIGEAMNYLRGL